MQFDDVFGAGNVDPFGMKQQSQEESLESQAMTAKAAIIIAPKTTSGQPVDDKTSEALEKLKDKNVKSISSETLFQSHDKYRL